MNIKITNVLSDITGLSGMRMINAILEGVRDPIALAQLAHSRCKASIEIFEASLEGTWDEDHLFELKQSLEDYKHFQRQANECDLKIEEVVIPSATVTHSYIRIEKQTVSVRYMTYTVNSIVGDG